MTVAEYVGVFVLVAVMGAGLPGPGDAALIAGGTAAGEGRLNLGFLLVVAAGAWMLGSAIGYEIGHRYGRALLEHPGRLEKRRHRLLAKGDQAFGRHDFVASATLPGFLSGIFRVRFGLFMLGALAAGAFWIGLYVVVSYFLGADIATAIGSAGTKALLGIVVVVIIGLTIRFGWAKWRSRRRVDAA
ncbi:MAG: DedA family protein [Actinomycetota bacterium]|nr:DedA family protein [Actinomycetota bacterium]